MTIRICIDNSKGEALCGKSVFEETEVGLVDVALQSNCDDCRAVLMVGPLNQKGCALKRYPVYAPRPMRGFDTILDEKRRRSDGK